MEIRKILALRSKQLSFRYFQANNTENISKLIETFLKYNMRANVCQTLKMFLAYECWRKNLKSATEIVKLCIELNIPLTDSETYEKYLDLLLNRSGKQQQKSNEKKITVQKYKFQF